ncbi:rhodanese-like domain-containing protein [Pleomorphomonas sp. PLEO]|uniref:rhodanese-like domain-containing protein n=1 Tax=Pleomorphomonas sp. PLEO TaxID=3239306 RepID=UPI00351DB92B
MGAGSFNEDPGYAGDVGVRETWEALAADPSAVLIDVRTVAEWNFVGLPDLGSIGKRVLLVEWQRFPDMAVNPAFADELGEALADLGVGADAPLYFICRSGARSRSAATLATAGGFTRAFNVAGGFEGALGPDRHRGCVDGWKASGLPWIQS